MLATGLILPGLLGRVSQPMKLRDSAYKFYMIEPVVIREVTGDSSWQLAEVRLYDADGNQIDLSEAVATNPEGDGGQNPEHPEEGPQSAVDGDVNTKFLDHLIKPLIVEFSQPVAAGAWSYITGNDEPARDIVQWKVWGSNDGINWTLLQEQAEDYDVTASRHEEVGPFAFV